MKATLNFNAFPSNEPGQELGTPQYDHQKAHEEALAFIGLILRDIGPAPETANWSIHTNMNELGAFYSIRYNYDTVSKTQRHYGQILKVRLPREWDSTAINELGLIPIK